MGRAFGSSHSDFFPLYFTLLILIILSHRFGEEIKRQEVRNVFTCVFQHIVPAFTEQREAKVCLPEIGLIWKYDESKKIQSPKWPTELKTMYFRFTETRWKYLPVSTSKFPLTYFEEDKQETKWNKNILYVCGYFGHYTNSLFNFLLLCVCLFVTIPSYFCC